MFMFNLKNSIFWIQPTSLTQSESTKSKERLNLFPRGGGGGLRLPELTLREGDEEEEESDLDRERDLEELDRDEDPETEGERRPRLAFAIGGRLSRLTNLLQNPSR